MEITTVEVIIARTKVKLEAMVTAGDIDQVDATNLLPVLIKECIKNDTIEVPLD